MKRALLLFTLLFPELASAGMRARYGGELRVVLPAPALSSDPALASTPADLAAARSQFDSLFTLGSDGTLSPALAAAVPDAEAQGRLFRLKLRAGIRFGDGVPVTARDLVTSLSRLLEPGLSSSYGVLALPLVGSRDAKAGRISGLAAVGDSEVQASLAFPYPDWPRALAHPGASLVESTGGGFGGTGPYKRSGPDLRANDLSPLGRGFADRLTFKIADPRSTTRSAQRELQLGTADAALLTVPDRPSVEGPALFTTYLALNERALGGGAPEIRKALASAVDPAELVKRYTRAPAWPMYGLLPPLLDASSSNPVAPQRGTPAKGRVRFVYDASVEDHARVASRFEVKLHDLGLTAEVTPLPREQFRSALAAGNYDIALVSFAALPEPGMALAQLVMFARGADAAREELRTVGAGADVAARRSLAAGRAQALRAELPLLPLYVQAPRLSVRPGVSAVSFDGAGAPQLADAWFTEPRRDGAR